LLPLLSRAPVAQTPLGLLPLHYRIHVEENALLIALGDRYHAYAAHHKRLVATHLVRPSTGDGLV
jgi:protein-S-isoprenylcysteine O-methyltransferase Ste14